MLPQSIRLATLDDLPCLIELESYWRSDVLAASEDTLRRRLTAHANGQFVAVATNGSLLGAIYTQRVASYATLLTAQRETELELHVPAGSVIQLLGIVQRADARVGDQLRSYVLLHARRDATVERVCGVTRCRAYKPSSGVDYQAHVKEASDPSLLFHTGAGATIGELVPTYRSLDSANLGYGVIVCYELRSMGRANAGMADGAVAGTSSLPPATSFSLSRTECEIIVCEVMQSFSHSSSELSEKMSVPFMDLGIDSLDSIKFVRGLNAKFAPALTLGSTVIFEHSTIRQGLRAEY